MKKVFIIILICFFVSHPLFSQHLGSIHNIEVNPELPSVGDSISLFFEVMTTFTSIKVSLDYHETDDTIHVRACYIFTGNTSLSYFNDTLKLGTKDPGKYHVKFNLLFSEKPDSCVSPLEDYSTVDSFIVTSTTPIPSAQIDTLYSLPVPASSDDDIMVNFGLSFPETPVKVSTDHVVYNDTIEITACYASIDSAQPTQVFDSVNVGWLDQGDYTVKLRVHSSADGVPCHGQHYLDSATHAFSVSRGVIVRQGEIDSLWWKPDDVYSQNPLDIHFRLWFPYKTELVHTGHQIKGDTLEITTCHFGTADDTPGYYIDSIQVYPVDRGHYVLHLKLLSSKDGVTCDPGHVLSSVIDPFTVHIINSVDERDDDSPRILIHPNPSAGIQTIHLSIPFPGEISVVLHDIHGKKIKNIFTGRQEAGVSELAIDLSGIPGGVYFYRVAVGEMVFFRKVVKL